MLNVLVEVLSLGGSQQEVIKHLLWDCSVLVGSTSRELDLK